MAQYVEGCSWPMEVDQSARFLMRVEIDDPARPDVFALLEEHLRNMHGLSPPGSVHAPDVSRLQRPEVTFWSVRDDADTLLGCGALQELGPDHCTTASASSTAGRSPTTHSARTVSS